MSDESKPITAKIISAAGKYVVLNAGGASGITVGSVFERGTMEPIDLRDDPDPACAPDAKDRAEYRAVTAEVYVERVFDRYCLAVPIYAHELSAFDVGKKYILGHSHRATPNLGLIGKP